MEQNEIQAIAFNVKRFRAEYKWTQRDLAEQAGISLSSVKALERGALQNSSVATIGKLSRALNRSFGDLLTEPRKLEHVRFRANSSFSSVKRMDLIDRCAQWLDDYCFVENLLGVSSSFDSSFCEGLSTDDVKTFAEETRKRLGYCEDAPIPSVAEVLRKCNVKLWYCRRKQKEEVFGLAIKESPQATGVVVFQHEKVSNERIIFTTIHEFAHLLLHERSFSPEMTDEDKKEELEANIFAGYFLMPKKLFLTQWQETTGDRLVVRVLRVKRFFRVSYLTVLRRLIEEGIFDHNVYVRFATEYKKRTGKNLREHKEPHPLTSLDVPRDGFQRLVCEAALKGKITVGRAAEILKVPTLTAYELVNQAGGIF